MTREGLKEEIEDLREELYRAVEEGSKMKSVQISKQLDILILEWMMMQRKKYEKKSIG